MPRPKKSRAHLVGVARAKAKGAAKARMHKQVQSERTQRDIREEEVVDLNDEMSVGSSVSWTETCDAVAAFEVTPIDTTVQQQQPKLLSQTFTEIMHDARSSELRNCTEDIAAMEESRTPKNTRSESLAESWNRKRRKRVGKVHWRKVRKGEDKRFEKAFHEAITNLVQNDPVFKRWDQERQ